MITIFTGFRWTTARAAGVFLLAYLLLSASHAAPPAPAFTTADPTYASRALDKDELTALSGQLVKYRAQVLAFFTQPEMGIYNWHREQLAAMLERCGALEAAKTVHEIRLMHGPPELLNGIREIEQAHQLSIYAVNFKYQGVPGVIINGGADLRETLLHETFALTYPDLSLDDVAKRVDQLLHVKASAAYMDFLRKNPDATLPRLQTWVYGSGYDAPLAFTQQFWTSPGADWQRWGRGTSKFQWNKNGFLEATTRNNEKGDVDEFLRNSDVAPFTERDTVTFTGYFQVQAAALATGKRASQLLGVGSCFLSPTSSSRGLAVILDATPEGTTLRAILAPGTTTEAAGNPVPLAQGTIYGVQVVYTPTTDNRCQLSASIRKADGSLVGTSTLVAAQRAGFLADRLYLGSNPQLTDGGTLTVRWYSVSVESEVIPIFRTPLYQGRVRIDPGDLAQFCGARLTDDLRVVYQRVNDLSYLPMQPPSAALTETTAEHGTFPLVSTKGVPFSLVARAPAVLTPGQTYALWVGKSDLAWSLPALVNEARPAWISPTFAYAGGVVTVVGRNLDPFPAATGKTVVRLRGPETYLLTAENDGKPETAFETYAARVTLPTNAKQGVYTVEVNRDGTNWALLEGRSLMIYPPPPAQKRFDATQYGATGNDETDDTVALTAAIAAAAAAGGGEVYLPGGNYFTAPLVLTRGVSLTGAGTSDSRLTLQYPDIFSQKGWGTANTRAIVTACGYQVIRDLWLYDPLGVAREASENTATQGIALGEMGQGGPAADYVTITRCRFTDTTHGIRLVWAAPVRHCTITDNIFQPRQIGILISGVTDSIIRHNLFLSSTAAWTYPLELSGARQVEVSDNVADGQANGGWRNGYFWNLSDSNENNLVCCNSTGYSGDKGTGNGEAFAYDANGDALHYQGPCIAAIPNAVVLPAGWTDAKRYLGAWVRVVDGKGLGQSRKILSYTTGRLNLLQLSASWDVLPDATSALAVTNLYWQVYTIDNLVDERRNVNRKAKAGVITPYGSSSECVVDSNRLFDSEGIMLFTCDKSEAFTANYFTEVRHNLLVGRTPGANAYGGIFAWYGAEAEKPSAILGYGTIITANQIRDNDYNGKGAISFFPSWSHPTTPICWKEALIFGNSIMDVPVGIQIEEAYTWNTVIGKNTLVNVATPLVDKGKNTVQVPDP